MARINYSEFYKNINFDVNSQLKETYVVKQNDTLSRGFYVKVIQNGRVVQPTEYDKMTLYVKKPDGKDIFEEGTINFDRFKIGLPNQALTVPGAMKAEFTLRGADGEVISSKDFTIIVNESFPVDPVESTDEFGALQSALAQIAGFAGELQDAQLFSESIKANLGELEDLDTDAKENVVAAINELNGKIDNVLNSDELETLLNAKVDKDTLGDMSQLLTEEKEVIVFAINELVNDIEEIKNVSDIGDLLQLLNSKADKSTTGDIVNLVDFEDEEVEINNLVEAVNYTYQMLTDALSGVGDIDLEGLALSEDLGDKTTLTTTDKTNLVNAINEINQALKQVESVTDVDQLSILLSGKADKSSVGSLSELNTTQKNNLVAAINEVNAQIGDVDLSEIFTLLEGKVSQEDFDTAVNVLQSNIDAIELTPGPPGPTGEDGQPGQDGQDGKSAYQIWLDEGNDGTEQDFLESLEGPQGPPGEWEGGGDNLGSVSSNDPLVNVTTEDSYQINVSYQSEAHYHTRVYQYYIENDDYWITLDSYMFPEIEEDYFEDVFLIEDNDKLFIYGEVSEYGDIYRIVDSYEGQNNPDLYQLVEFRINYESHFTVSYYSEDYNEWVPLDSYMFPEVEEDYFKEIFLIEDNDKLFIYAEVSEYGDIDRIVDSREGQDNPGLYQLVEVRLDDIHGYSQVNASRYSQTAGEMSQVNASDFSQAAGEKSQVNASRGGQAAGEMSQVNASDNSQASGEMSQVNVSMDSQANETRSQVNASSGSAANEYQSQVNASVGSINNGLVSQINSSSRIINNIEHSTAYGYGPWTTPGHEPGAPLASNVKIRLLSMTGDINHSGVLNSGHNFTDFAELFPNLTGEAQGYGLIQTVDGYGVRPANSGDQVVGVTSATAGVVLGETPFSWAERWLKDEWGAFIYHDILDEDWEPNEDKGETEEDRPTITVPKENPEWDPNMEQVTRQERPDEWTVVGLVGQVYVRLDENVQPMDYVKPLKDGVGQTSSEPTNIRVMKITQEFDGDKGYKIGFCLLK